MAIRKNPQLVDPETGLFTTAQKLAHKQRRQLLRDRIHFWSLVAVGAAGMLLGMQIHH